MRLRKSLAKYDKFISQVDVLVDLSKCISKKYYSCLQDKNAYGKYHPLCISERWYVLVNGSDTEGCGKQPETACGTLGYMLNQQGQTPLDETISTKYKDTNSSLMENVTTNAAGRPALSMTMHVVTDVSLEIDHELMVGISPIFISGINISNTATCRVVVYVILSLSNVLQIF